MQKGCMKKVKHKCLYFILNLKHLGTSHKWDITEYEWQGIKRKITIIQM